MELPTDLQASGFSTTMVIANQMDELKRAIFWLKRMAKQFQWPERTVFKLDLVLNEALPNIINHAYQDRLTHDIVITLEDRDDRVMLEITDDGMAFDPFARIACRGALNSDSGQIGGRGIHLIKCFTDEREYRRINHNNVVRVKILKTSRFLQASNDCSKLESGAAAIQNTPCASSLDPIEFVAANRDVLASLPLCSGLPFDLLEPFFLRCEYKRLNRGNLLLSPGKANRHLYLLLSGRLTIHIDSHESEKGFPVQPGDFVGEVSIIDGLAPTASVTASEDSLLLCIHERLLWSDFLQIPGTARNLLQQIAARMRARNAAFQESLEQTLRLEHLQKELCIARDLQAGMLPHRPLFPKDPRIEVDALIHPAKEVGGDLFDAFPLDSERICLAIGDVAGKGVPAALFMVRSITVLRTEMLNSKDLLQTIRVMNETLSEDNPMCMFVTLMICVVDLRSGRLQYVNGGHNRPLFGNFNDGFHFLEQPRGILVGIQPDAEFQIATRDLKPRDLLILYTDGVTEAMNPDAEEFTESRLLDFINRQSEQSASELIAGIRDAVQVFTSTAEQSDDLTLLALRYMAAPS
ncbi:MAG: SpoIIE family protein phosphatase [Methylococcaceae bacterium]|nr:SpoIIE family protein phosphatase [Methylococcaceae bacterium]